jgi:hypothetical protein
MRPSELTGNGFVFGGGGDDVVALLRVHLEYPFNAEVVGLGGTRGEDDFFGVAANEGGNLFASVVHGFFGGPAEGVVARGSVAEYLGQVRHHGLQNTRI